MYRLISVLKVGSEPVKNSALHTHPCQQLIEECIVVNRVECCGQVKKTENDTIVCIKSGKNVILHMEQCCFCAVQWSVCRLKLNKKVVEDGESRNL